MRCDPGLPLANGTYRASVPAKSLVLTAILVLVTLACGWGLIGSLGTVQDDGGVVRSVLYGAATVLMLAVSFTFVRGILSAKLILDNNGIALREARMPWSQQINSYFISDGIVTAEGHKPSDVAPGAPSYAALILTDAEDRIRIRLFGMSWPGELLEALRLRLDTEPEVRAAKVRGRIPLRSLAEREVLTATNLKNMKV